MAYDLDLFVNVTSKEGTAVELYDESVDYTDEMLFETLPFKFSRAFTYNKRNTEADPVIVYELNGAPVAWWDCENVRGYIAK